MPIGHCFSNKETFEVLVLFFKLFKKEVGNIQCVFVMTDDAPQYYKAWVDVFCKGSSVIPIKLLCWWHVHKSISKNVNLKINDSKDKEEMIGRIKSLQNEIDKAQFELKLKSLNKFLDQSKFIKFKEYFDHHYLSRIENWAMIYRVGSFTNTNMTRIFS